ncbi:protein Simiate-like [Pyrus ussuriensis x Pyrus communis]|uniref:Protein Abitram n=1 Tax=Pyrus ussuriensis x Pyrus communis TaxID=2448454 RepID=A0A5N5FRR0_9ROSA|nr:protein Simiate-like [Pyrus ussuriensis x Pyrus communis]
MNEYIGDETNHAQEQKEHEIEDPELHKLILPNAEDLPLIPPSSVESNFVSYFAPDFMKPRHDQYIYRHANGKKGGITAIDFNVGKSDRIGIKVTGKRKKESNSALCKVCTNDATYIVRCCVKGSLLEVNGRLTKQPDFLNSAADREGYIAIIMPKPADWLKVKDSLLSLEDYKKLREVS